MAYFCEKAAIMYVLFDILLYIFILTNIKEFGQYLFFVFCLSLY